MTGMIGENTINIFRTIMSNLDQNGHQHQDQLFHLDLQQMTVHNRMFQNHVVAESDHPRYVPTLH